MIHLFYYGTWLMGILSLISLTAVYTSNRRVIRDLKNIPTVKDKWLRRYLQEYQKCVKENTAIHNPAVYLTRRMRGRKIGPIAQRTVKGAFWCTFALSFLMAGAGYFMLERTGMKTIVFPLTEKEFSARMLLVGSAAGTGVVLLLLKAFYSAGYQEKTIETNLLDYMENQNGQAGKVVAIEQPRQYRGRMKNSKKAGERTKAREQKEQLKREKERKKKFGRKPLPVQDAPILQEVDVETVRMAEREKRAEKVEERVREAAATDERYKHLLNEEEEKIVKDVIKEFLT